MSQNAERRRGHTQVGLAEARHPRAERLHLAPRPEGGIVARPNALQLAIDDDEWDVGPVAMQLRQLQHLVQIAARVSSDEAGVVRRRAL